MFKPDCTRWIAFRSTASIAEASNQAFIHLPRHSNVVQIVLSNLGEPSRLIQLEHPAAFHFIRLARRNSQRPRDVVQRHPIPHTKPPAVHRVVDASHVELGDINRRPNCDVVHQTSLKDEWQIKPDDVVTYDLVDVRIKASHQGEKLSESLFFTLFPPVRVNAKNMFASFRIAVFCIAARDSSDVNGYRQNSPRGRSERAQSISTLLLG